MFLPALAKRLCASLILTGLATAAASAQSVEDFYKGKTVSVLVGFTTGNGADSYARLVARWYSKYLPGAPNVVVQNMPGSGSLTMTNNLYNVAAKDGTVYGIFKRNVPLEPLMGNTNARVDPRKFTWLGSTNTEPSLCVAWHGSPVNASFDISPVQWTNFTHFLAPAVCAAFAGNATAERLPILWNGEAADLDFFMALCPGSLIKTGSASRGSDER
jgi:hypothetical protein